MNVNNVGPTSTPSPVSKIVSNPVQKSVSTDAPPQTRATDRLTLSGASHLLSALKANDGVRIDKVAAIKEQIANGTYEDETKLDAATNKLLDELNK